MDELSEWLAEAYAPAYRSACLLLRNPADAEEAVQEAFLRVWRFRDAIPDGPGRRAWLYRVVVNACLSRLRHDASWRGRTVPLDGIDSAAADEGPAASAERSLLADQVLGALERLPEHLRVVVVLRFYAGLSEREIATAIARRPGTVKSRLSEARRRLSGDPALAAWAEDSELEVAP